MTSRTKLLGAVGFAGLAVAAIAGQAVQKLVVDGTVISTNVTQVNGRYEVPLDDIAKYFGYAVGISGTEATLTRVATPTTATPTATTSTTTTDNNLQASQVASSIATASPLTSQSMTVQPKLPTNISVGMGKAASVNGFEYTVTAIKDSGASYKDVFDQRGRAFRPKWKTDSLVVIDIEVTNRGTNPRPALLPSEADITVFDGNKIGYLATAVDKRQTSDAVTTSTDDYGTSSDGANSGLVLAPGGTIHFAAIASMPKGNQVANVTIKIPASATDDSDTPRTIVTVSRN
jgi:hypothetical protein